MKNILIYIILIISSLISRASGANDFEIGILNNPSPGYFFSCDATNHQLPIYDNYGQKVFTREYGWLGRDFLNLNYLNNKLYFFNVLNNTWEILDGNLNLIDSIKLTNPYFTDYHDIAVLPNGNVLLLGYEFVSVDMSEIVTDGKKDARVLNYIIQELDNNKQVVFQWNTIDHLNITDATEDVDLTASSIDPYHINALEIDLDGNLLISIRCLDEIIKVNKVTGDIIWRLGGTKSKNNQFTFTNDTQNNFTGFSHQHSVRKLSNGNIILFDNGNLKSNQFSRAVEYSINEINKSVTKVWEYYHNPLIYSNSMGNVQRLSNGNTLIGWGISEGEVHNINATEVNQSGDIVMELRNDVDVQYKVMKYVFKENAYLLDISSPGLYSFNSPNNNTNIELNLTSLTGSGTVSAEKHYYTARYLNFEGTSACAVLPYRWVINNRNLTNISGSITIDLSDLQQIEHKESLVIFRRDKESSSSKFSALSTTYNPNTNKLQANINALGEFIIGFTSLNSPGFLSPVDNSVGLEIAPNLQWYAINSTEIFNLQLSADKDFTEIVLDTNSLTTNHLQLSGLKNNSVYYWRVKAINQNCQSDWSDIVSFKTIVGTPVLTYPENLTKEMPSEGKLKWTFVDGGENYRVQLSESIDFQKLIIDQYISTTNEVSYKGLKSWTTYYWRVAASNDSIWGHWSDIRKFTTMLSMVNLSNPVNNSAGISVSGRLNWQILPGATIYTIQIASDSTFYKIDTSSAGIGFNYFDFSGFHNSTIYYWRVKGGNSDVKGEWSPVWSFKTMIKTPVLSLPKNNVVNVSPTPNISWEPISESELYQVDVSTSVDFSKPFISQEVRNNSLKLNTLNYNSTYYWRVRAKDNKYYGNWSEIRVFTVQPENILVSPNLSYPENNAYKISVNDIKLQWEDVFTASKYNLQLSTYQDFKVILIDSIVDSKTEIVFNGLNYNSTYFWHVNAINDKTQSNWSATRSFTTKLETPKILLPLDNDINMPLNVKLIWSDSPGAEFYQIQVARDELFQQIVSESDNLASNIYIPDNMEQDTKYYWKILGFSMINESDWSDIFTFTTSKTSGVNDLSVDIEMFKIYPNPASNYLYISTKSAGDYQIKIVNSLGMEIFSGDNSNSIDLRNFASGLYYYQISFAKEIYDGDFIIVR